METYDLTLPAIYNIDVSLHKNKVKQLLVPEEKEKFIVKDFHENKVKGYIFINEVGEQVLAITNSAQAPESFKKVLRLNGNFPSSFNLKWIKHPNLNQDRMDSFTDSWIRARNSWVGNFNFKSEIKENGIIYQYGLRPPQIGAIHAALSHWIVSDKPATIVMPTGTGKTETMLGLLVANQCKKLLVVVPTDPLRNQISEKFISFGVLKQFGVIGGDAEYPVVGILMHKPKTFQEVDDLFSTCNVVITTMSIAGGITAEIQDRIASHCSHLFIDEAHHIAAPTWANFREKFKGKQIVQFTATPFRNDGKYIDGKVIFNYPLEKAQKDGYFRKINFCPVIEFSEEMSDKAIAERAVAQLKTDLENGYDHLLMVRVNNIKRTEEIFPLYNQYEEYQPVIIHSQIKQSEKSEIIDRIKSKKSRIIICVDMLGEGFDLPELKIAALHDIHKSLGITLQFTGRFTRTKSSIGEASLIANIANQEVNDQLKKLYSEDADWNVLLKNASTEVINTQLEHAEFLNGFTEGLIEEIPIQNIYPKMSTVVYKTNAISWYPEKIKQAFAFNQELLYTVHSDKKILVAVVKNLIPVSWGDIQEITNISWDIYIAYWNESANLLFINSTVGGTHRDFAESLINNPVLISGESVFRCFHGINRTILQNVGLNDAFFGPVRFRMYAGTDIGQGLSEAQKRNTFKSNIFGFGYENGERTSIGCSYKGKIWSKKITTLSEWCKWCDEIGTKLLNDTINVDTLLEGVLKPTIISKRPGLIPISIEWPMSFTTDNESNIFVVNNGVEYPLYEAELQLVSPSHEGNLKFKVCTDSFESQFEFVFNSDVEGRNYQYIQLGSLPIEIHKGSRKLPLTEWFLEDPPIFRFVDGSYMENNIYVSPQNNSYIPYDRDKIITWSWDSVDITKESQKEEKRKDSIQYYLIQQLLSEDYDVIFDDDSAGEAADVITIRVEDQRINVEFYHCKYSNEKEAGSRVSDLYAVCGQTQKSIRWKENIFALLRHIEKREAKRIKNGKPSRFEKGDLKKVSEIKKMAKFYPYTLDITIVQPGLSKSKISTEQMELLSATENYLQETYKISMRVIASD